MLHNFEMVFRLPDTNYDPLEYAPTLFELPGVKSVDAGDNGHIKLSVCIKGGSLRRLAFGLLTIVREKIPGAMLIRFSQRPSKRIQVS